jgi:hypothetical protein
LRKRQLSSLIKITEEGKIIRTPPSRAGESRSEETVRLTPAFMKLPVKSVHKRAKTVSPAKRNQKPAMSLGFLMLVLAEELELNQIGTDDAGGDGRGDQDRWNSCGHR